MSGSWTNALMASVRRVRNGSTKAVSESGIRIMSDSWISWNPRIDEPSKPEALVEHVGGELRGRYREVLHQAGQVAEPDVDDLDVLVRDERQHLVGGSLVHGGSLQRPSRLAPHANNWP